MPDAGLVFDTLLRREKVPYFFVIQSSAFLTLCPSSSHILQAYPV